jgi:hypothetical protein
MTPCYCASCKIELPTSCVSQARFAWCPRCRHLVAMSCFKVQGWVVAVLLVLTVNAVFTLA